MAVVYSLACWGGLLGKTVTPQNTTSRFRVTDHGLRDGHKLWFNPASAIPPQLSYDIPYYSKRTDATNEFELYRDEALTDLATFQAWTAVRLWTDFIVTPAHLAVYGVDITRYGDRIYDGLRTALVARGAGAITDDEVIELGEAWDEVGNQAILGTFGLSFTATNSINGVRTPAYHFGVPGAGHTWTCPSSNIFYLTQESVDFDGFDLRRNSTFGGTSSAVTSMAYGNCTIRNCIVQNIGTGACNGIYVSGGSRAYNNLIIGVSPGQTTVGGLAVFGGAVAYNNTITKCGVGVIGYSNGSSSANTYNNLSVGNDWNWGNPPLYNATRANGNIGELRDLVSFTVGSGTTVVTLSETEFFRRNYQVFLSSTGTLPSVGGTPLRTDIPYYLGNLTTNTTGIQLVYNGASQTFSDAGTGTHYISRVWSTTSQPANYIDFTDPDLVFKDWANNDMRPAGVGAVPASQAKMVDAVIPTRGTELTIDIAGNPRPNYKGGAAEGVDVGAFEYDHGFGPRPATHTLTLLNVVVGSRISIQDEALATVHYNAIAASSTVVIPVTVYGDARDEWRIKVRKGSEAPFYQPFLTQITAFEGAQTIFVSQIPDE